MGKENTQELIANTISKGIESAKEQGFDLQEDEFTIVQPLADNEGIIIRVAEEDGDRGLKVEVTGGLIMLDSIDKQLNIYG